MSVASVTDPIFVPTIDHEREGFIRCGTLGHSWHDYDTVGWTTSMGVPLTLRCERCGTERRDVIGAHGQLVYPALRLPPGLQVPQGSEAPRPQPVQDHAPDEADSGITNTRSK